MIELSLRIFFKGFNASKFVLYVSLLIFVILLSLRLDGDLPVSYAVIFAPLWACNAIVLLGAFVGIISFCARPPSSSDVILRTDFVAMLMTTAQHVLLFGFEFLAFYKLEHGSSGDAETQPAWVAVFAPLFFQALVAVVFSIWAIRHEKSFEFELFFSVNVVEFVFIAFKLDEQVEWSWAIVFVPLWVVLSLCVVGVLYTLILAVLLARSMQLMPAHRRQHVTSALVHTLLVIPLLIFLILLTAKLDAVQWHPEQSAADIPYVVVCCPLGLSLLILALLAFGQRGGNVWWFAMRKPFCHFLLDACPCLQQYANVSYKFGRRSSEEDGEAAGPLNTVVLQRDDRTQVKPVVPFQSIECPD